MTNRGDRLFENLLTEAAAEAVNEDIRQIKYSFDIKADRPNEQLKRLFNRKRQKYRLRKIFCVTGRVAAFCLISLAVITTCAMHTGAIRFHFSDLTVEFADRYADVRFDRTEHLQGKVKFPTLPEDWAVEKREGDYCFTGPNGEYIIYCIMPIDTDYLTDNTELTIEQISLSDGEPAYLFRSKHASSLIWKRTYIYELYFENVSLDTVLAIADSIE